MAMLNHQMVDLHYQIEPSSRTFLSHGFDPNVPWLVGGWALPLWKIWLRQWEGWHPIYDMENKKCSKPPTSWYHILKGPSVRPWSEETHHVSQHPLEPDRSVFMSFETRYISFMFSVTLWKSPRYAVHSGWKFWSRLVLAALEFCHSCISCLCNRHIATKKKRKVHSATSSATITVQWTATDRRSVSRSKARSVSRFTLDDLEQTPLEGMHFWKVPPNHPSLGIDHFSIERHGDLGIPHDFRTPIFSAMNIGSSTPQRLPMFMAHPDHFMVIDPRSRGKLWAQGPRIYGHFSHASWPLVMFR